MADDSVILGELAEEYSARVRQGQLPDLEDYAHRHPPLAERIRALFPTLLLLEGLAGGPLPAAADQAKEHHGLAPGSLFGPYRIEQEIGRGGMGIVYAAVHRALDRRVALKVLPIAGTQQARQLERFLREAQTAAGLHHTNIVPVFDVGQVDGIAYYAMQLIAGQNLDRLPSSDLSPVGRERFRWVAEIGAQAAEGLAHAHQRGVIHRDVKPSNLLLDEQGVVWITDFGLARRLEDVALTHAGTLIGTPRYMSPEQAEAAKRPVDHRSDIYSLGATLYEILTRRPAFDGRTPEEVVGQILEREPVPPRRLDASIPRDLETIIQKAMAKRPQDRYASARDLAEDMRHYMRREPIQARRVGVVGRVWRWARRNPARVRQVATVAAVLLLGTIVSTYYAVLAQHQAMAARAQAMEALRSREEAEQQADDARKHNERLLYAVQIHLAQKEWNQGDGKRVRPAPKGLSDWEWRFAGYRLLLRIESGKPK